VPRNGTHAAAPTTQRWLLLFPHFVKVFWRLARLPKENSKFKIQMKFK